MRERGEEEAARIFSFPFSLGLASQPEDIIISEKQERPFKSLREPSSFTLFGLQFVHCLLNSKVSKPYSFKN